MADDFEKALKAGKKAVKELAKQGHDPYVAALDDLLDGCGWASEVSLGTMEIPLQMVVGTRVRGRQNLFAANFMPLAEPDSEFATKWRALLASQRDEGMRDPIVVFEYLHRFYVQEGNKRVSVANYLEMATILAKVTRIMTPKGTDADRVAYDAFRQFYSACPMWELEFSDAGSYQRLADLLHLSLDEEWPEDLVRKLKAFYAHYAKAYRRRRGPVRKSTDAPDAFLAYLIAHPEDDLLGMSERELKKRLKQEEESSGADATERDAKAQKPGLEAASTVAGTAKAVVTGTAKSALRIGTESMAALTGQKKTPEGD